MRQKTEESRESYAVRAGIEGTHAQAIRRSGLRRTRYKGLAKTHLQHVGRNQPLANRILGKRYTLSPDSLLTFRGPSISGRMNPPPGSMLGLPRVRSVGVSEWGEGVGSLR
jgi:hypothetical protein